MPWQRYRRIERSMRNCLLSLPSSKTIDLSSVISSWWRPCWLGQINLLNRLYFCEESIQTSTSESIASEKITKKCKLFSQAKRKFNLRNFKFISLHINLVISRWEVNFALSGFAARHFYLSIEWTGFRGKRYFSEDKW